MTELFLTICMLCPNIQFVILKQPTISRMVRDEIAANWLSTTGAGDFNGDGICNLEDYSIITSDDYYYQAWLLLFTPRILR